MLQLVFLFVYYKQNCCSFINLNSSNKLDVSGTTPPWQYFIIPPPAKSFNISAGSLAPPCCNNFDLRAVPVAKESGSSSQSFLHIVAAKHLAYR
uniref:Mitochondrial intermediate peptidase n=1 Tax=Rhizophora mucronata TaxID=61149 RepID=A0A2P2M038_RHIMU